MEFFLNILLMIFSTVCIVLLMVMLFAFVFSTVGEELYNSVAFLKKIRNFYSTPPNKRKE